MIQSERDLAALAVALGAREVGTLSVSERNLLKRLPKVDPSALTQVKKAIARGEDPLGDLFCALRSPEVRRSSGATYTPPSIVSAMTTWVSASEPARIIDPGVGSARFLVSAGRALKSASLLGIELDPLAALLARAHLASAGLAARSEIVLADYRDVKLPKFSGTTAFLGNPPYVRHHTLDARAKQWLVSEAKRYGIVASQLAGLHVYFFLATANLARPGDLGCFVTASEWLDVNYGGIVRKLLLDHLGLESLQIVDPKAMPFADATTTAAISCFRVGARPAKITIRKVENLQRLAPVDRGLSVTRERLEATSRWSVLSQPPKKKPSGFVELGELCRVHRGQVTGNNRVWIEGEHSRDVPNAYLVPAITKARELFNAGSVLRSDTPLRRVIDLPTELDELTSEERKAIQKFLRIAKTMGAAEGFIAQHRKAWWAVGLRSPAPILATYMARRPPAFVRNVAEARHINIAHGLYPREPMAPVLLDRLAQFLSRKTSLSEGRTYAGGLTKFEPKEMERLLVPGLELLRTGKY